MTLGQIAGCQVTGGDKNGGTTSGYLTEENTDRADGSQTTTEETTTEEEWKSIVSGEYYKQGKGIRTYEPVSTGYESRGR